MVRCGICKHCKGLTSSDEVLIKGIIPIYLQVNLPLMRQNELSGGIELRDEKGERACKSKSSAVKGIAQVELFQP